jgi:hypothetical protein
MIIIKHLHRRKAVLSKKKILKTKNLVLICEIVASKDNRKSLYQM